MNPLAIDITIGRHDLEVDDSTFNIAPKRILTSNLTAPDWTWDGNNIALVRSLTAQTIGEHVRELHCKWLAKGVRALRSDELAQLAECSEEWPRGWRISTGSRIFFAGTVYEVQFSGHTEMHIYAARYDAEIDDWLYGCESFEEELRPGDRFASIIAPADTQRERVLTWSNSFARRSSYISDDRPYWLRLRYNT